MTEPELVVRCRRGENGARKELYTIYAKQMLALCYRYVGDIELAHDLLHDGFLKIYLSFPQFTYRGEGSLMAWMRKIFVNLALAHLQKREIFQQIVSLESAYDLADSPEPEELEEIPTDILMRFVSELPTGYRTVFNLYTFEEYSHKEIAAALHINEKSSSSQLYRAKNLLIKKVTEYKKKNRL